MSLPDTIGIGFEGKYTQFDGLRLDVVRKNDTVLLQFEGIESFDDLMSRKTVGLLDRLRKGTAFTVTAAEDVPDAHWNAPDVTDKDRESSIFLEPTAGKTPEDVQYAVITALKLMRAKPMLTNEQRAQLTIDPDDETGFTLNL